MIINKISSQNSLSSSTSLEHTISSYNTNNSQMNGHNFGTLQFNKNMEYVQNKYLQPPAQYTNYANGYHTDIKKRRYEEKCALIIQRQYRRYQSQKQIERLDQINNEDQQQLQKMSQQNNATASRLQEDIKSLKMELFKSLNQLKGFQQTEREPIKQSIMQYQSLHTQKAKIIQQFWKERKQKIQSQKAIQDIQNKRMEELKIKYNQLLEDNLLQQKVQFKQVLNSYLEFIEKLMADKKEISEQCKKYHELHKKELYDNRRLEKAKEELNKKIGELYVEQSLMENENIQLKEKISEYEKQQKQGTQQNQELLSKQESNLKELQNVKRQIEDEKNNMNKEKEQILKEQNQLQKLIQTYQNLRRRDKSLEHNSSIDKSSSDSIEAQVQLLKNKITTIEQEKGQIEVKLNSILQQNERFVEEKQILLKEQQNFLQKEHKILEVIKINKDMRNRYKSLKDENEILQQQLNSYRSYRQPSIHQSQQSSYSKKHQKSNDNDENQMWNTDIDLVEKYTKYSRNSSPQYLSQNNSLYQFDGNSKTNLASIIKEERLKTIEAMKQMKNNFSTIPSRENSLPSRK